MARSSPPRSGSPSDISPTSLPDGKQSYFGPLGNGNTRLGSIQELGEHHTTTSQPPTGRPREASSSSITFDPTFIYAPEKVWGSPKPRKDRIRTSSPPAPHRFQHHVSFDNFAGGEPTENNIISFTLNVKHKGYAYKKRSRTFMVGIDENDYSNYALQWMLEELVDDGDEIVCLRVVDKDAKISSEKSVSRKSYQEEARKLMSDIQRMNDENRAICIILEFAVGKVHTTFQKMIQLYEPAMLIVGTRGRSLGGFQGLVGNRNSFSKWCLQYSPIPVVVVRPNDKREKKKLKRTNDPTRQDYLRILQESGQNIHEANATSEGAMGNINMLPSNTPETEAHEVAAALGLPARFDPTLKPYNPDASSRKVHRSSDVTSTSMGSTSPDSRSSSPVAVMKSPNSARLESPAVSDVESDSDNEGGEYEAVPADTLLEDAANRQKRLHDMEVGEAAALAAGRKRSIGNDSIDSEPDGHEDEGDDLEQG